MTRAELFMAALCIFREARNQSQEGQRAIFRVLHNRATDARHRWRPTITDVILEPFQFSSFNIACAAHPHMITDTNAFVWPRSGSADIFESCCRAVELEAAAIDAGELDPTSGATYYYSPPLGGPPTAWGAVEHCCDIGELHFYR